MHFSRIGSRYAFLTAALSSLSAHASDADEARALFERGQTVAKSGKIAEACGLYEQSHKLAPNACGVIVNLAECTEAIGQLPEALSYYEELESCATSQKQAERRQLARERQVGLHKQLVHFDFGAYVSSGASRLRVDGTEVPRALWTKPQAFSARAHTVVVETDGCASESRLFDKLQPGSLVRVPVWQAKCGAAASATPGTTPGSGTVVHGEPWPGAPASHSDGSGWRTAGLVVGGAGVVSLGIAGVGIVTSLSKTKEEKQTLAPTYNALGGVGLGLIGVGAVMYFVLGKDSTPQHSYLVPTATPQSVGFQAGMSW